MLTIVIPALNAAASLVACLAALGGADKDLVVDGGSTDDSAGIAERAGARVIVAPRGRRSGAR